MIIAEMVTVVVFASEGFVIATASRVVASKGVFLIWRCVDVLVVAFEVGGPGEYCLFAGAAPRVLAWIGLGSALFGLSATIISVASLTWIGDRHILWVV